MSGLSQERVQPCARFIVFIAPFPRTDVLSAAVARQLTATLDPPVPQAPQPQTHPQPQPQTPPQPQTHPQTPPSDFVSSGSSCDCRDTGVHGMKQWQGGRGVWRVLDGCTGWGEGGKGWGRERRRRKQMMARERKSKKGLHRRVAGLMMGK
ncbi:MAG: hypothetical protein FRX49_08037 [Trebouxia sp. A1-2]|nr:MAG: hypothetical protein FRX49_08037 [Trebouxia sp. A1-2]